MKIAFTISSNNYLAQTKTLVDSFLEHNPGYQFVVGFVDEWKADLDRSFLENCEILEVSKIGLKDFERLLERYELSAFANVMKASYFKYLFKRNERVEAIVYLDSDVLVFDRFSEIEEALQSSNIVVTPHMLTPKDDLSPPSEKDVLVTGIFNLGFIAIARSPESFAFLDWWEARSKSYFAIDPSRGLFGEQLWVNLAPVYFKKVCIEMHPGYNMAYWNLYERRLCRRQGRYLVNGNGPLVFFHFCCFNFDNPDAITREREELSLKDREDLRPLFEEYRSLLARNRYQELRQTCWAYAKTRQRNFKQKMLKYFAVWLKRWLGRIHGKLKVNTWMGRTLPR